MLQALIKDKIYYRVFDKTYQQSTHFYGKHRAKDAAKIAEIEQNLRNISRDLGAENIAILKQIHSDIIIDADDLSEFDTQAEGDALITTKPNIALTILTADCVPVLLSSSDGTVIGAAHCGWKGAKGKILNKLVLAMKAKGAHALKAVIGPSIQQSSYEVDSHYYQSFLDDNSTHQQFFIPSIKAGHYMFDLPAFVIAKLQQAGINDITHIKEDTYSIPEKYPSYRRACHAGEPSHCHNILSTIIIK